ncbi:hypothetical protein B0H14DRAFT_3524333 [Mycena olivaceomarginata]|nr:hypothetical protein B0H14DRAFT_3524333 [Mycena olivaceomarginata]
MLQRHTALASLFASVTRSCSSPTSSGAHAVASTSLRLTARVNPIPGSHAALCHRVPLPELSSSRLQPSLQPFLIVPVPAQCPPTVTCDLLLVYPQCVSCPVPPVVQAAAVLRCTGGSGD